MDPVTLIVTLLAVRRRRRFRDEESSKTPYPSIMPRQSTGITYCLDLSRSLANLAEPMKLLGREDDTATALDESTKLGEQPLNMPGSHART